MSSATKIQQSMNCCCVQLNNPPSTQATKHLAACPYLHNRSNAHSGISATRCQDAKNSGHHQASNTTAKQAMCINVAITSSIQCTHQINILSNLFTLQYHKLQQNKTTKSKYDEQHNTASSLSPQQ